MRLGRTARRGRFVLKSPIGRAFQILILAGFERPKEGRKPHAAQEERRRNEPDKRRHSDNSSFAVRRRKAFTVTMMEEVDMAMAAMSGVTRPATARGTKSTL